MGLPLDFCIKEMCLYVGHAPLLAWKEYKAGGFSISNAHFFAELEGMCYNDLPASRQTALKTTHANVMTVEGNGAFFEKLVNVLKKGLFERQDENNSMEV